jgi:hypothetical protein
LTHISMIDMLHASIVSDDTTVYRQCWAKCVYPAKL